MLELRDVSKRFGDFQALHPTSLKTQPGQITALLGTSGCGKSTLLRLIVGLLTPDSGTIYFDDQQVTDQNILQLRHRMGYMIQDGGLFPHLTVRDNVALLARHLGREQDWIANRVDELAELTHLPEASLERFPAQISGGQRQRVALMRALCLEPDLILLDEPMGALDPVIRSDLQTELREIFHALQKTVVMVTHDIGEAGYLANDLCILNGGRIVQRGALRELVESPADEFVTRFINAQRSPLESMHER